MSKSPPPWIHASEFLTGEWSRPQNVAYNGRDVLLYAVGIGCDEMNWIYEQHPDFEVFPSYAAVLQQKGITQDLDTIASSNMYLGKNWRAHDRTVKPAKRLVLQGTRVGVDAERYIEKVKPLPVAGASLQCRHRLYGLHEKRSGALTETESEIYDPSTGEVYYRLISGNFSIGAHSFTGGGKTNSQSIATPSRPPDAVEDMFISERQAHVYRLSGDYNPLHIDPHYPGIKGGGFDGPILHGLCTMGHAARAVLKAFGGNRADSFKALKIRFASPFLPGHTLLTKMWKEGSRVVFTAEVKETGKVCINNAYLELNEAATSKL